MTWDLNCEEVKKLKLSNLTSILKKLYLYKDGIFRIEISKSVNNKKNDLKNIEILILRRDGFITELRFDISKTFNKQPFAWKQAILWELLGSPW